jgi:hypothetical protein
MRLRSLFILGPLAIAITACGIQIKTPPEIGVRLNVDGKGLAENVRSLTQKSVPPGYYAFLKDENLKKYILEQGAALDAQCLLPVRSMVDFENQGTNYMFTLYQQCYAADTSDPTGETVQDIRFMVYGTVDPKTNAYQIEYDLTPEVSISSAKKNEVEKVLKRARVLVPAL